MTDTTTHDVADVLDTLISIFALDDNPGRLIAANYVTDETERLRWLAALGRIGQLLGESGAIDTCLRCRQRPAGTENLCRGCYDAAVALELSCDWLSDEEADRA